MLFKYLEKSELTFHFILGISIEHEFFLSRMEAHNFRFVSFQSLEFLSLRDITAENVINALIDMIFHHSLIGVTISFYPSQELPEMVFNASFPP
jgi:hypothetical protein